jgi:two-component system sensor histidine kinase PilS (NtrC family)
MPTHFRRRVLWLIGGRAAVVTLLLGLAIVAQINSPGALPIDPFFFLIGLTYALTVVYSLLLRQTEQHHWIIDVQLAVDVTIVSALIHLTGGLTSLFSTLYTLPIIAASAVRSLRGGLTVGVLSAVLFSGLVSAQYLGTPALPVVAGVEVLQPPRVALYTVGLNVFGFIAVAALSGYLSEGLRRAGQKLEQASHRIADLQAFSDYAINSLASGLTTIDLAGNVLTMNRAGEAIVGIPAGESIGQPAQSVLQLPVQFDGMFGLRDARPPLPRVEYLFTREDGRRIELGVSTTVLMTPRGESGFVITFQDVTEARRQEREARVQQRLAAVGEMAAGIAHEIRNPLASMSGSIQILRQELPLTEEQTQLMDIVMRESERLNETIRSFLAYARPQRNAAARLDVRTVVTDTATLLQNSPERQEPHRIAVRVPDEPVWCLADESQLRQVVWNLATNGLRAMPGGGTLNLVVQASAESPDAGQVTLEVRDEGVGIPADQLEEILHPFRGGFSKGTGLGLSIVHRIVSDYGGELLVTSQEGSGSTVTVKLPTLPPGGRGASESEHRPLGVAASS